MSKGFLVIAENSKSTNYVEQAYALALSIKMSQKETTSISLVTNNKVSKKIAKAFDQIITIPWTERVSESRYAVENRWKLFHISPYDETIVLDADMLMLEDISDWWSYCNNFNLKFCNRVKNYKLEPILQDTFHRKAFNENGLTNPYFALHYFKKSEQALNFYKVLEFVCNNWEWCYNKFAPVAYQDWLSMDLASAIAIEITGYHEAVIDSCSPLDFVHMKLPLQGWEILLASWQDTIPLVLNSRGELIAGNIKQTKLFHYVEKNFISKKILSRLEELSNV